MFVDPITIRKRPLSSYKIMPEEVLTLAVIADSDPSLTLQYKWTFMDLQGNQKEIENNEFWKISNNSLTIDVSQVSDPWEVMGFYSVKIYHKYDQKIINITVETATISTEDADQEMSDTTTIETDIISTGSDISSTEESGASTTGDFIFPQFANFLLFSKSTKFSITGFRHREHS